MYLEGTGISCGIKQLIGIGEADHDYDSWTGRYRKMKRSLKESYENAMRGAPNYCTMVVASLQANQKNYIRFLERHGFERVTKRKQGKAGEKQTLLFLKKV